MYETTTYKDSRNGKTVTAQNKEEARRLLAMKKVESIYYLYDAKFEELR